MSPVFRPPTHYENLPLNPLRHIGIVGPIASADMAHLLDPTTTPRPVGYTGAPLLATLIGELLRRGYQVSAFTLSNDVPVDRTVVAHGPNLTLTYCSMRPRAWQRNGSQPGRIIDFYKFEIEAMRTAIEAVAPDVIHAHWAYEFALAALACSMPHVVTCHDSPYRIARLFSSSKPTVSAYRWLRVLMARRVLQRAKLVTAVSPYMRDAIQGMTVATIDVVPNPVDDLALQLAQPRSTPNNARLVMICNGWDPHKNAKRAIRAFAAWKGSHPKAELHFYGSGFGTDEPGTRWCRQEGLDAGLHFHGAISHHALLRVLPAYDLLVHPSLEESFGLVVAEAMAIGLPVVAGRQSGAVPWVVGTDGMLCDVTDEAAIALSIERALQPGVYERISAGGIRAAAERFSTKQVVDQLCSLYRRGIDDASCVKFTATPEKLYGNH